MIVLINEFFHDHEDRFYYVDTDKFDVTKNPIEKGIMEALKEPGFYHDVRFEGDVEEENEENMRAEMGLNSDPDSLEPFWSDPAIGAEAYLFCGTEDEEELPPPDLKPDAFVKLVISFDC